MEHNIKSKISAALNHWLDPNNPNRSMKKLGDKSGVSTSVISHIKRELFEINGSPISDAMFYKLASSIGYSVDQELHWTTDNFNKIIQACKSAQSKKKIVLLDSELSGLGKTYALEYYASKNDKVIYIKCVKSMSPKDMLDEILSKLSIKEAPKGIYGKLNAIRQKVTASPGWELIFDELEYLRIPSYPILKEIIDFTYGKAAIVCSGLGIVAKIEKLAKKKREGFPQLKRRIFTCITYANPISKKEMVSICNQHNIMVKTAQEWFINNVQDYQMLSEYIKDALYVSQHTSAVIDAEFLADLFKND